MAYYRVIGVCLRAGKEEKFSIRIKAKDDKKARERVPKSTRVERVFGTMLVRFESFGDCREGRSGTIVPTQ